MQGWVSIVSNSSNVADCGTWAKIMMLSEYHAYEVFKSITDHLRPASALLNTRNKRQHFRENITNAIVN